MTFTLMGILILFDGNGYMGTKIGLNKGEMLPKAALQNSGHRGWQRVLSVELRYSIS